MKYVPSLDKNFKPMIEFLNEFKEAVKDYIYDYNTSRPHSKLRYKTPDEYETAYFEKLESYIKDNQSNNIGSDF